MSDDSRTELDHDFVGPLADPRRTRQGGDPCVYPRGGIRADRNRIPRGPYPHRPRTSVNTARGDAVQRFRVIFGAFGYGVTPSLTMATLSWGEGFGFERATALPQWISVKRSAESSTTTLAGR